MDLKRNEPIAWRINAHVKKYNGENADARAAVLGDDYDEAVEVKGNLLTTAGLDQITKLMLATGTRVAPAVGTARIGVGDTNTAAAVGNTDLAAAAGSSHRQFEILTSCIQANGVITMVAVFSTAEANFAWAEWGIDVSAATVAAGTTVGTTLWNRKVAALGTKTSAAAWTFTVTITLA